MIRRWPMFRHFAIKADSARRRLAQNRLAVEAVKDAATRFQCVSQSDRSVQHSWRDGILMARRNASLGRGRLTTNSPWVGLSHDTAADPKQPQCLCGRSGSSEYRRDHSMPATSAAQQPWRILWLSSGRWPPKQMDATTITRESSKGLAVEFQAG